MIYEVSLRLLLVLSCLFTGVVSIDWQQWLTRPESTTQGMLTITAGIALYGPHLVENVYGNCRVSIISVQCAKTVGRAIADVYVGHKSLEYATGWHKSNTMGKNVGVVADFFNNYAIFVNVTRQLEGQDTLYNLEHQMKIVEADGIPIAINISEAHPYDSSRIWVTGLKSLSSDFNQTEETLNDMIAVYRKTKHGGIAISPLAPMVVNSTMSASTKRYFGSNEGYFTEGVTLVVECQYDLSPSNNSSYRSDVNDDTILNDAGESHNPHRHIPALHAYLGSLSRLKCTTTIYDETQSDDTWRY